MEMDCIFIVAMVSQVYTEIKIQLVYFKAYVYKFYLNKVDYK